MDDKKLLEILRLTIFPSGRIKGKEWELYVKTNAHVKDALRAMKKVVEELAPDGSLKIAYWNGCLVKVLKEYATGQCNIEISYPNEISKIIIVEKSELTAVKSQSI